MSLRILHEQACTDLLYDQQRNAIPDKIKQIEKEIGMGLWDTYLFGNYELYKNSKVQIGMSNTFQVLAKNQQFMKSIYSPKNMQSQYFYTRTAKRFKRA